MVTMLIMMMTKAVNIKKTMMVTMNLMTMMVRIRNFVLIFTRKKITLRNKMFCIHNANEWEIYKYLIGVKI